MSDQAMTQTPVVLASTSPYRRQILSDAGVSVRCVAPGVDEARESATDPVDRATRLAVAKARAVSVPGAIVIGADQVACDPDSGELFGKPADPEAHRRRLRALRGRAHHLISGFAVIHDGWERIDHSRAVIHMRADVTDDEIDRYVATGEGSGCAAGYAAEGRGGFLIERIDGDWTTVIGLPLFPVMSALRARGWRFDG